MIELAKIRTDGGTQSRAAINDVTVAEYAEAMADPDTVFPPVVVYHDGKDYWLADGFHRVAAWARVGRVEVPAEVRQGDRRRAVLHSCGANAIHGLRRTNDDKRRAIMTLLDDEEWSQWSDREIARQVRVSPSTVAKYRTEVLGVTVQMDSEPRTYTTKHGKEAVMDTSRIGKSAASEAQSESVERQPVAPVYQPEKPDCQPEPDQPVTGAEPDPKPDPDAKLRAEFHAMTPDGRETDWIGLRQEVADLRKRVRTQTGMIADLKRDLKELAGTTDLGPTVSNLRTQIAALKLTRDDALTAAKRMEYRLKKAEARVAELESQEVEL